MGHSRPNTVLYIHAWRKAPYFITVSAFSHRNLFVAFGLKVLKAEGADGEMGISSNSLLLFASVKAGRSRVTGQMNCRPLKVKAASEGMQVLFEPPIGLLWIM